ncbi:MAG: tetratricopeptide repeat protein [Myxococcota bacterium]|nr:tetratricopeptide repeat protein [Myxococcota bacterium]MDW8361229.1 tetratricopeptide repeat protein [Myxococcales bacterium]
MQARIERLQRERRADRERIRELEGMLALARSELRELRDRPPAVVRETVRIGDDRGLRSSHDEEPEWVEPEPRTDISGAYASHWAHDDASDAGPRPVLRLYGSAAAPLPSEQGEVQGARGAPSVLAATAEPLVPVETVAAVALPRAVRRGASSPPLPPTRPAPPTDSPTPGALAAAATPRSASGSELAAGLDPVLERYRAALVLIRDRRFSEALDALDALLRRHPDHPHAIGARYWRAEVHYARRSFEEARNDFEAVARDPLAGPRRADALFKVGLCHLRLGDRAAARRAFEEVRRRFPESLAARLAAAEEGAS